MRFVAFDAVTGTVFGEFVPETDTEVAVAHFGEALQKQAGEFRYHRSIFNGYHVEKLLYPNEIFILYTAEEIKYVVMTGHSRAEMVAAIETSKSGQLAKHARYLRYSYFSEQLINPIAGNVLTGKLASNFKKELELRLLKEKPRG